jgi:hypothetical protein
MPGQVSNVKKVFKQYPRQAKQAFTHTSLDGGTYCVPVNEDAEQKIFGAMEKDLRDGVPYFINEIATPVFRMFFDIDFIVPERLNYAQIEDFTRIVHEVIARFFPADQSSKIPNFFELIALHSDSPMICETRSNLDALLRPQNEFTKECVVTISNGRVNYEGKIYDVAWQDEAIANGAYRIRPDKESSVVHILTENAPAFYNPQVDDPRLTVVRRVGSPPPESVRVLDELTGTGASHYTASTAFAIDDNAYFINSERNKDGLLKHGVHIILPEVKVQIEQALIMREALVERLRMEYGVKNAQLAPMGWSDVVDNAVYGTGRGLRMYGANKTIKCPDCRLRKDQNDCVRNNCNGKIDIGRPHLLHSVYVDGKRSAKHEQQYKLHAGHVIRKTSIRTVQEQSVPGWGRYTGCPSYGDSLKTTVDKAGNTVHDIKSRDPIFRSDVKLKSPHMSDITDPDVIAIFEKHIRKRFVSQYKNLRVIGIKKTGSGFYFISVGGEGQHFCLNKMPPSDHTSNTIYFQCTREGICARCRCPKLTTESRAKGMCRDFCSTIRPLSQSEVDTLFPESTALNIKISGKATKKQRI